MWYMDMDMDICDMWWIYVMDIWVYGYVINGYMGMDMDIFHAFFVYYENADLVYDVIRMRQLSKQTLHELSPNDNSKIVVLLYSFGGSHV